ncbi:ABC transporter ATP-binding protein [Oxalobacter aliiformigenes]|uniref:ABC transporter ATP-binding protein n=1 Tax=Oxalobacter aliiformigenes TaxID=2946593 RepID=UPI0022AF60EA|nr:ABC transporter ATP-binding protein [Oxalobacter aliiformigenes]MCZ4065794.1 ABC transporter ATP-binding protein [Oxalobacter aliiformigenes]WAV99897.1 ABC transporter ATP-binding protein [Oxalobacter aliiformigenes]
MVNGIVISGVNKRFTNTQNETVTALSNIHLEISAGSFTSLIGPSGCGKSTLLRLVAGLIRPDNGTLALDGKAIEKPGSDRGFMFQEHTLFPWLTIRDNIAFSLRAQGIYTETSSRVDEFLALVGLKDFGNYYPYQLSGGMCQRASLARAIVSHPKVLLLDEPFGALDAFTRMSMQDELLRIWKERNMTMIMVTHDVDEAIYLSDRIVIMSPRPGRITKILNVPFSRPRARSSNEFLRCRGEVLRLLDFGGTVMEPEFYL